MMALSQDSRHKLIWGWLRLFLGFAQMSLVAASFGALITIGVRPVTWAFCVSATVLTIVSRLLYRGRDSPEQTK
jgi:hypothetical protein